MVKMARCRAGAVAQVVEHLPSNHEALSSNSSTAKKKKSKDGIVDLKPGRRRSLTMLIN
jgi:hypothetical protein